MSEELSITNVDDQGNITYGTNSIIQNTAAPKVQTWGFDSIALIQNTGEGVISGVLPGGETGYLTSRTLVRTVDLLAEGEIEGLVSGEYVPVINDNDPDLAGQLGWKTRPKFVAHANDKSPEKFLRSIYLNETPIVSAAGYYNFQNVEVAFSNGTPSGIRDGNPFLNVGESNEVQKTRVINERLLGPDGGGDSDIDWKGEDTPTDPSDDATSLENPFIYNNKTYRLLNKELEKIKINIKIPALMYTKQSDADIGAGEGDELTESQIEQIGETNASRIKIFTRFRPVYHADFGIGIEPSSSSWYPVNRPISTTVKGIIRGGFLQPIEIDLGLNHYGTNPETNQPVTFEDINTSELVGWEVEVTRLTFDSIQSNVQNQTYVDSITEIYSADLSYPNSALMAMNFNAQYFSQIPNRAFDLRLQKVLIPEQYDPIRKSYELNNGIPTWNGKFQTEKQWTDNPAWVYYDLLTNRRYGLGKFINNLTIDKWTLFEIAKFCDTLVPDGFNGLEPRFTCNAYINTREDAYKVLQDFASVFRGILYYGLGNIHAVQDRPREAVAQFANSNVKDGNFQYSSSAKKARSTVAVVRYNDKQEGYKPALEYVEDAEGIRKYGYIEKEITAFACTSKAQAIRLGKWILLTELYETEICNFVAGPEAVLLRPGDVIKLFDSNRYTSSQGGRVIRASANEILFDREVSLDQSTSYNLTLTTPTHFYDSSIVDTDDTNFGLDENNISDLRRPYIQTVEGVTESDSNYTVSTEVVGTGIGGDILGTKINSTTNMFDANYGIIRGESTWSLLNNNLSDSLYSVISVKEAGNMEFQVECMEHRPDKYASIEEGVPMDDIAPPGGENVEPKNPGPITLSVDTLLIDGNNSNTKQLKVKITRPRTSGNLDIGSTIGYKIFIKSVHKSATGPGSTDFLEEEMTGDIPNDEFLWRTVYLAEQENQDPEVNYLPPQNDYRYIVRAFSVNGVSMYSQGYTQNFITVTGHLPVRDIRIHSLRMIGSALDESGSDTEVKKPAVTPGFEGKNAIVAWEVDFPLPEFKNLDLTYRISIHEPNTGSATPLGTSTGYGTFETSKEWYDFSFEDNVGLGGPNAPYRHYDLVVRAFHGTISSSGPNDDFSTLGWDIVEIDNPRPDNYHLTPRTNISGRPGAIMPGEKMTTEQWIDANGNIRLDIIQTEFRDLAGGFMYLSHHPFSGQHELSNGTIHYGDFDLANRADNAERLSKLCVDESRHKQGEFQILEIPFEVGDRVFRTSTCCEPDRQPNYSIVAHPSSATNVSDPSLVFDFQNTYHLAVKFYDSFDKEVKKKYEEDKLLDPPTYQFDEWDSGLWIGFVRHRVDSQENILTKEYEMYHNPGDTTKACGFKGDYLADLDLNNQAGTANGSTLNCYSATYGFNETCSGLYSCPIHPTKYYSANAENGFKYWIRLNVNGQWEGNGISTVKALSWGDVQAEYGYDGFWEYSCNMTETSITYEISENSNVYGTKYEPNDATTKCRFRQGTWNPQTKSITNVDGDIYYSPDEHLGGNDNQYVTGSVRVPPDGRWPNFYPSIFGPKAGVPWEANDSSLDQIVSTNEFGDPILNLTNPNQQYKDRPLYGYRRYRVYFDVDHLPPPFQENQLPSYSVIGINAWNGPYESWPSISNPDDITGHLALAKDGYQAFTHSVRSWMQAGDLFENIPGVWNHHPAGFGQGFGGLKKTQRYFDVHLGRMIDDSYLNEGFFAVVTTNDYSILEREAEWKASANSLHYHAGFSEVYFAYDPDGDGEPGVDGGPDHWTLPSDPDSGSSTRTGKLYMADCYNDGWNGDGNPNGTWVQVLVNGSSVGNASIGSGQTGDSFDFDYEDGDEISLVFHSPDRTANYAECGDDGVWDCEVTFELRDKDESLKWSSNPNTDCDDYSMSQGANAYTNGQTVYGPTAWN